MLLKCGNDCYSSYRTDSVHDTVKYTRIGTVKFKNILLSNAKTHVRLFTSVLTRMPSVHTCKMAEVEETETKSPEIMAFSPDLGLVCEGDRVILRKGNNMQCVEVRKKK